MPRPLAAALPTVRPAPYYHHPDSPRARATAAELRALFAPKIARTLPGHAFPGKPHGWVPAAVKKYKAQFPYFLRTDIAAFFPSVDRAKMTTAIQIAHRDINHLSFVPKSFKQKFLPPILEWSAQLPTRRGLPLGSALASTLAQIMLVPLWLEIKRQYNTPLLVSTDDVLLFARTEHQAVELFALVENRLHDHYDLALSPTKTTSGRWSATTVSFAGFAFAGGYTSVTPTKAQAFVQRIDTLCAPRRSTSVAALVKALNHKIDGFGHYYKHADVRTQFAALDIAVRARVRAALVERGYGPKTTNRELDQLGLRSLAAIKARIDTRRTPTRRPVRPAPSVLNHPAATPRIEQLLDGVSSKLGRMIDLQRKTNRLLEQLLP